MAAFINSVFITEDVTHWHTTNSNTYLKTGFYQGLFYRRPVPHYGMLIWTLLQPPPPPPPHPRQMIKCIFD